MFNAEERCDMMLMIGGQGPVGQPICKINWPRGESLSSQYFSKKINKFLEKWDFDSTLEGLNRFFF